MRRVARAVITCGRPGRFHRRSFWRMRSSALYPAASFSFAVRTLWKRFRMRRRTGCVHGRCAAPAMSITVREEEQSMAVVIRTAWLNTSRGFRSYQSCQMALRFR